VPFLATLPTPDRALFASDCTSDPPRLATFTKPEDMSDVRLPTSFDTLDNPDVMPEVVFPTPLETLENADLTFAMGDFFPLLDNDGRSSSLLLLFVGSSSLSSSSLLFAEI
jgi:hypothetical protein